MTCVVNFVYEADASHINHKFSRSPRVFRESSKLPCRPCVSLRRLLHLPLTRSPTACAPCGPVKPCVTVSTDPKPSRNILSRSFLFHLRRLKSSVCGKCERGSHDLLSKFYCHSDAGNPSLLAAQSVENSPGLPGRICCNLLISHVLPPRRKPSFDGSLASNSILY